jgi:uncharacterized Zn finger protein (UPF0148 family)
MMSIMGYPVNVILFCPRCGRGKFDYDNSWTGDGKLSCDHCGLVCYIVEADESEEAPEVSE